VKRYLPRASKASARGAATERLVIIVGGEVSTTATCARSAWRRALACPRCDALGEPVVANLCNMLAAAIRKVNPQGELIACRIQPSMWWSCDKDKPRRFGA